MKICRRLVFISILLLICIYDVSAKKPRIKVYTDKNTISLGDSVTISWESEHAKSIFCYEISNKRLPLNGSITIAPEQTTAYTFFADKRNQSMRKKIRITVLIPTIVEFRAPSQITDEEQASISWIVENAEYVRVFGLDEDFGLTGRIPFKASEDTIISITAYNKNGFASGESKKVKVQLIEKFDYPFKVPRNSNVNISWEFKNTDSIKFINLSGALPPIGDIYIEVNENSQYRAEIYRSDGTYEVKDFSIQVYDSKIKVFTGNKTFFRGEDISITWLVEDADSVKLSCSDISQPLKGFYKHKPESDEIITLTAYLNGNIDQRAFKTHMISRKYISGETDYSKVQKNVRLDYEIFSADLSEYPNLVKLYVLVVDSSGNFVHGLAPPVISDKESKKHFIGLVETYTGGKSKQITNFKVEEYVSKETIPRDISMVLDYSGSMIEPINTLEHAAKSFISNKFDQDNLSIVKFDDKISVISNLTKDKAALNSRYLRKGLFGFGGGTALYAAVGEGLYTLNDSKQPKEIIIFTDGYENSSLFVKNAKAISAMQIAKYAKDNDIKITCIAFGDNVNRSLLEVLSAYTGGKYFEINSDKEIVGVWTELPYLSANYYVVSFKPNSLENFNGVKLTYNNNIGEKITTHKPVFTEIPDDLDESKSIPNAYWNMYDSLYNGKTPITLPQAIGYFNFNGDILIDDYVENVELLVEKLIEDTSLSVAIFGHTDLVDTDEYNLQLSERRCDWAKKFFVEKGIIQERIILIPLGEKHPIWTAEDEDWKAAENRRIEVLLLQ